MRNIFLTLISTGAIIAYASLPASSQTFTDTQNISPWSQEYISILQDLGVIEGYPDGSFRPKANLTREEYAVSLLKAMDVLEQRILSSVYYESDVLYTELVELQAQLLEALAKVDEAKAIETVKNNNFVALSLQYVPDRDGDTAEVAIEASGKLQVVKVSDTFAFSVRPWVNTNTEVGGALTADAKLGSKLELFAGIGAAYRADQDSLGGLTGVDNDVIPYVATGVSYNLSDNANLTLDGKIPFTNTEAKEPTVGIGVGYRF